MKTNSRLALNLCAMVLGMVMLAYASSPLYRMFCKATGFAGTPAQAAHAPDKIYDRVITVTFNTDVSRDLPWRFTPEQKQVDVNVGQKKLVFFSARNLDTVPVIGTATFNVTPEKAAQYFDKIQCFCFKSQRLAAGQAMDMPVSFFIDPAIMRDPALRDVKVITLSYTFFRAKGARTEVPAPQNGG